MLGRCPRTWSKRFPTRGKVLGGAPIPRTLEDCTRTKNTRRHPYHEHSTENHIITTKTTSQRATAEKWLGKVHRSQAFGRRRSFLCRLKQFGERLFGWQCSQGWWCEDDLNYPSNYLSTSICLSNYRR